MRQRLLFCAVLLCVGAPPAHALRPGQALPAPPTTTLDGATVPTGQWLREELVAWCVFTPGGPNAPHMLKWLAPPAHVRAGYRAVGVPVADGPLPESRGAATLPLLAGGHRWRPQLGVRIQPPLVILTRPPGTVVAVLQGADVTGPAIALAALAWHVQREDWSAVHDVLRRAGQPLVDPTFLAARSLADLGTGNLTSARDTATGLAEVGPNGEFKALGRALLAELARRSGNPDAAGRQAQAGASVAEGQAVLARLALAEGDLASAQRAVERTLTLPAVLPWSSGAHRLLAAHVAWLRGRSGEAATAAAAAARLAPASWRCVQAFGLARLRADDMDGIALLRAAAAMAPADVGARELAHAAADAFAAGDVEPASLSVVLETGSVPHARGPGAGPTAGVLLARALDRKRLGGAEAYATSARGHRDGHAFGAPLPPAAALGAAKRTAARYLVLLRMHAAPRGVVLNTRVVDVRTGKVRGLDSMVWTPDATLGEACDVLANRVRTRLRSRT